MSLASHEGLPLLGILLTLEQKTPADRRGQGQSGEIEGSGGFSPED